MTFFKQFSDIFGAPGTGVHRFRVLDVAIVDYLLSIVLAFAVAYQFNIPVVIATILVLSLGILFHYLFGLETSAVRYIGLA